jgi:hypothetical protein
VPAEIITRYLFGQEYGFLQDVQTTKNLYDKRLDRLFGLAHLGRFIPKEIPLFASLFRQLAMRALGLNDPGSAFLDYFMVSIAPEGYSAMTNEKSSWHKSWYKRL